MGTFANAPKDKRHLLSDEDRAAVEAYEGRGAQQTEGRYTDVIGQRNTAVSAPARAVKRVIKSKPGRE
jgi:hypothetical protein